MKCYKPPPWPSLPVPAPSPAFSAVRRARAKAPRFRLGLVTYNIAADWTLDTLLKNCKAVGISPVELRTTHKHGVEPTLSKEERKEVKSKFADAGIEIWGLWHDVRVPVAQRGRGPEERRAVQAVRGVGRRPRRQGGEGAARTACPTPRPWRRPWSRSARLIPCGKAAADAGVEIWVEVHGPGTSHPPHVKTMMETCGHPKVGITWNSNPTDVKDGSVAEYFKLLQPWLRSCHINEIYKDASGVYPYRELFRLMRESGYDRVTLMEVGRKAPDPETGAEILRDDKAPWTELARG